MTREISTDEITKTVANLCILANIEADDGIRESLIKARKEETETLARNALDMIIENMRIAKHERMPMCQDTGMVDVFVKIGQDVHVSGGLCDDAINEGVRQGYKEGYFRSSIVSDPIKRINTGDNTPAVIHYSIVEGAEMKITVMPKGFGSENKSAMKMLTPSQGVNGIENFIIETVKNAGADPCPPIVVGVGVGGTMEKAALLAKEALSLLWTKTENEFWAELEERLLGKINGLNIGVAGFKGKTTALGVKILTYPTHIAGMPVAVNIGCHVSRHKTAVI